MLKSNKIINFLVLFHINRSPSQVYRLEAYLKYLNKDDYFYNWIISDKDDNVYYYKGLPSKIILTFKITFKRLKQIFSGKYSNVVINRECFPIGTIFFETIIKKWLKKKLIYDFDDAIWLPVISEGNKKYTFLKSYSKFSKIMKMADVVIAGNNFLADYAKQFNSNVQTIPSCIDLDLYTQKIEKYKENDKICIGWSGSETTLPQLLILKYVLLIIQKKYKDKIYFKILSSRDNFKITGLNIKSVKWKKENEVEELKEFDLGIMPLPDDQWSKGKCSMKGIQYMGLGIPTIMSNIGMNKEVIQHGKNGLLASTGQEWIYFLSQLIESKDLRNELGANGRRTVEENYSIQVWKDKWLSLVNF